MDLIDFAELKAAGLLPAPTREAQELMQLCQCGDDSAAILSRIADLPALKFALLTLSGLRTPETPHPAVADALAEVGAYPMSQLVLALDLLQHYRRGACPDFDYPRHWAHAFATACAAQALAVEMPEASSAELFCQGLLAGIGHLGLATARPRSYARMLRERRGEPSSILLRKESALYGYSHLSMGAALLRSWRMGHAFSDAVLCQEAPHMATDRHTRHLARLLQLASCMADLYLAQPGERKVLVGEMAAASNRLQLDTGALLDMVDEANVNWRHWCAALDLQTHLPPVLQAATHGAPAPADTGLTMQV
jgi:hypothetical protein